MDVDDIKATEEDIDMSTDRQNALRELIAHVRFPLMERVYFSNRVPSTGLLSMDDVISIYRKRDGDRNLCRFSTEARQESVKRK